MRIPCMRPAYQASFLRSQRNNRIVLVTWFMDSLKRLFPPDAAAFPPGFPSAGFVAGRRQKRPSPQRLFFPLPHSRKTSRCPDQCRNNHPLSSGRNSGSHRCSDPQTDIPCIWDIRPHFCCIYVAPDIYLLPKVYLLKRRLCTQHLIEYQYYTTMDCVYQPKSVAKGLQKGEHLPTPAKS